MKIKHAIASLLLATSVVAHASPEQPTDGVNGLSQDGKKVEFTYSCMDYPAITETIVENKCIEELKALKRIQCRSDWLLRQEPIKYYECGAKFSTGDFKTYFENKVQASKDFIRKYEN